MATFRVTKQDKKTRARTGIIKTAHGVIHTPNFFPVGTQATIKGLSPAEVKDTGTEGILVNTYHMYLRPGADLVAGFGGLHEYMQWDRPIMTDSGGFQVFSLGFGIEHEVGKIVPLYGEDLVAGELVDEIKGVRPLGALRPDPTAIIVRTKLCKIADEGPTFVSHLDGSAHFFPPEKSIDVQLGLGSDLIVALDECTSPLHDYTYTKTAMERTHKWELRSLEYLKKEASKDRHSKFRKSKTRSSDPAILRNIAPPALYGVIQGGPFEDLRIESAKFVSDNDFFGVGIGGALVSKAKMHEILDWIYPFLDPEKPRHLFGIGTIDDIFNAVERGVDTFDCVTPTRLGRMGYVLVKSKVESPTFAKASAGKQKSKVIRKKINTHLNNLELKVYKADQFRLDITKSIFLTHKGPIDPSCRCYTCTHFSIGYLCHLFRSRELLAYRLATIHNLAFMANLMSDIRESIQEGTFSSLKSRWLSL